MDIPRISFIDRLKGLCIIAVVMGHFIIWPLGIEDDFITSFVTSFHMPVFMFLSGFVISSSPSFCKSVRKVLQFIFPMLIIGSLYVFFRHQTIDSFFFDSTKKGYWYLWVLSIFYLILSFLSQNNEGKTVNPKKETIFGIFVFCFFLFIKFLAPSRMTQFLSVDQCFNLWVPFFIGFMVRRYSLINYIRKYDWIPFISLLCYIVLFRFYVTGIKHIYLFLILFSIPIFIFLFYKRENDDTLIERELARFGKNSLHIYIYHYFLLRSISLQELGVWFYNSGNIFIEGVISLSISILIAYVCVLVGNIFKEIPSLYKIVYGHILK